MLAGALVVVLPGSAPAAGAPECGGIAPNPSVEDEVSPGGMPRDYLFTPAAPVPRSTPPDRLPKLTTGSAHAVDGGVNAQIQTPDGRASWASQSLKPVPGGIYTLSVWTGTASSGLGARAATSVGLRFADNAGRTLLEKPLDVTHDVASDGKLVRQDVPPVTAPEQTSAATFFATTNHNWVMWDCVRADLAAYTVKKEVQNPASGEWGASAPIPAGQTAHYRITVANTGSEPLTGLVVKDPWCTGLPAAFDLAAGATRALTCDHPNLTEDDDGHVNTATVTGASSPAGQLGDQKATATITVTPPPAVGRIGDRVWRDANRNGLQDDGEPGYADLPVTLKDGAGGTVATVRTGTDGSYLFDKRKDGTYQVCFDLHGLPDGLTATSRAAGDPALDSDVDPGTGCTAPFTLGGTTRERTDLDLGLAAPAPPAPAPPTSSSAPPPPPPSSSAPAPSSPSASSVAPSGPE
ncbi:SdrD B-like domain-containing protein [Amycolatopsis ultiminotia]|uniref:SdrD B-like domain-containing protein n=1 Tax=Amycolatopsis ultiminotia TaxID=543629 RepID=A0ABP6VFU0_9PSEU